MAYFRGNFAGGQQGDVQIHELVALAPPLALWHAAHFDFLPDLEQLAKARLRSDVKPGRKPIAAGERPIRQIDVYAIVIRSPW